MLYGATNWMFARVCCQALLIIRDGFFCPLLQSKQALAKRFHADWRQTMMSIIFIHFNLFADSKWASNNVHRFQLISTFCLQFCCFEIILFFLLVQTQFQFIKLSLHNLQFYERTFELNQKIRVWLPVKQHCLNAVHPGEIRTQHYIGNG